MGAGLSTALVRGAPFRFVSVSRDPAAPGPTMRPMAPGDVTAVARMEAATFSTPWKEDTFLSLLQRPGVELWVADLHGEVAAYAILWCILEEGELANIAVRDDLRGQGIGSELLDWMLGVAAKSGVQNLYLEVRESNEGALRLYGGRGFTEIGVRQGYYERPREDARVLKLERGSQVNTHVS